MTIIKNYIANIVTNTYLLSQCVDFFVSAQKKKKKKKKLSKFNMN